MARIALISSSLNFQVISLAKALMTQQNEITIVTSKAALENSEYKNLKLNSDLNFNSDLNLEIITPFIHWNLLEALRVFPILLMKRFDIFHFIFAEKNENPHSADFLLGILAQPFPGKAVAASFFHSPKDYNQKSVKAFLKYCLLVTWGTRSHLLEAKRKLQASSVPLLEVIPPILDFPGLKYQSTAASENVLCENKDLIDLVKHLGSYLVIPDDPEHFFSRIKTGELFFDQRMTFLFLSQRPARSMKMNLISAHCFYLGTNSPVDLNFAIKHSKGILLAFSQLSLLELQQFYLWSQSTLKPLLIRPSQLEMFPGIIRHEKTGWNLPEAEKSLRELLRSNPDLNLPRFHEEIPRLEIIDHSTNELNRLYHQALHLKS